jgi:transglutaminase-like putative cysteine protease
MKTISASKADGLLQKTTLLDYDAPTIQRLVKERRWQSLPESERIRSVYEFVRDEILFGYNRADEITASEVLSDGIGQCNTKATLLMALFRAVGLRCRFHGFTIHKELQKGAITGIWYRMAPKEIVHSWVEVQLEDEWFFLEGVILDRPYLKALQARSRQNADSGSYCGFGACTNDIMNPVVDFDGNHTYIQADGIARDFGLYNDPDSFYAEHSQALSPLKKWLFSHYIRHRMNDNVRRIRG